MITAKVAAEEFKAAKKAGLRLSWMPVKAKTSW